MFSLKRVIYKIVFKSINMSTMHGKFKIKPWNDYPNRTNLDGQEIKQREIEFQKNSPDEVEAQESSSSLARLLFFLHGGCSYMLS